jgi:hypothetical protein
MPWRHCIFTDTGVVIPPAPPLRTQPAGDWRNCVFTDTGVVFPPCPPLKTQLSRPCGSSSGPPLKDMPSRDILEFLEQIEPISATASTATTPIPAFDSPATSQLPCAVERAPLPAKLATGCLQRDEKIAIFEKSPSCKLRLGWSSCPAFRIRRSRPFGSSIGAHLNNKPSRAHLESFDQILTAAAAVSAATTLISLSRCVDI